MALSKIDRDMIDSGYSSGTNYSYTYTAGGDIETVTEKDVIGNTVSTETYMYDSNGDVQQSVKVVGSQTITTEYVYDLNGNIIDQISTIT